MNKQLLIIGASGHGKVCLDVAVKMRQWESIAFLDDHSDSKEVLGYPVIGTVANAKNYLEDWDFFVAIGNNSIRGKIQKDLEKMGAKLAKLIHPEAVIAMDVTIGAGSVVMPKAVINTSAIIGKGCIINTASCVEHDCIVKNVVHLSPNSTICGSVHIGNNSWIGAGACIINNITIGDNATIGAGAVVINDIENGMQVVGNPAHLVNRG